MNSCARTLRLLGLVALVLSSAGCARAFGSYSMAPSGLPQTEERLRRMLTTQQAVQAFDDVRRHAPADEMLYALYYGVAAYHAGDYAGSAHALDMAAYIADERLTKSLSRAALSVVSNDLVLDYEPGRTERLMIPYYAALARIRTGDLEGAAVEARRLSLLLQRYDDDRSPLDATLRATMRYVAGAVFEAAGEYDDADVAYRNAAALDSTFAMPDDTLGREAGTVVVVLEQGFVAHRAEQDINVLLLPEEMEAIVGGKGEDRAAVFAFVGTRVLEHALFDYRYDRYGWHRTSLFVPAPEHSVVPKTRMRRTCSVVEAPPDSTGAHTAPKRECVEREEEIGGAPYLWRIAWPVLQSPPRLHGARVGTDAFAQPFMHTAELSRGVAADFERERVAILARTIARSAAKLALTKGTERRLEERDETAARVVGILGNIGAALTERADTRSWHLLPAGVSIARLQLEPGRHELTVELDSPGGPRSIAVGPVDVRAGRVAVVPARAW
jgi:uncharacterized protein